MVQCVTWLQLASLLNVDASIVDVQSSNLNCWRDYVRFCQPGEMPELIAKWQIGMAKLGLAKLRILPRTLHGTTRLGAC